MELTVKEKWLIKESKRKQKKWYQCEKKIRYRNQKKALNELKTIRKKMIVDWDAKAYKCDYCNGWHLGHDKRMNNK
jgi:hypothetical protein